MADQFEQARPLAQHCPELTTRGPKPADRDEALAAWRRDLARILAQDLSSLLTGERPQVAVSAPEWVAGEQVFERIGSVAANSLLRCGEGEGTVLLSFDFANALALTDRSFGGDGAIRDEVPDHLPPSAALLVDQVAAIVARAVGQASLGDASDAEVGGEVIIRSEIASRLKPFGPATPCALFSVAISVSDDARWSGLLAVPASQLDAMLPGLGVKTGAKARAPGEAAGECLFAIPMHVEAVLAEIDMSLIQLERLKAGDEIPLAAPRSVPLRIGSRIVGHGSLGTFDERMAVRLTKMPSKGSIS